MKHTIATTTSGKKVLKAWSWTTLEVPARLTIVTQLIMDATPISLLVLFPNIESIRPTVRGRTTRWNARNFANFTVTLVSSRLGLTFLRLSWKTLDVKVEKPTEKVKTVIAIVPMFNPVNMIQKRTTRSIRTGTFSITTTQHPVKLSS